VAVRSQCKIAPSEPPETRIGWTGCQVTAGQESKNECERNLRLGMYTYSRLLSYDLLIHGTLSLRGYRTHGQSDPGRHWQQNSHLATMPAPEQCFYVDVCMYTSVIAPCRNKSNVLQCGKHRARSRIPKFDKVIFAS
jgi:hypothetical protein